MARKLRSLLPVLPTLPPRLFCHCSTGVSGFVPVRRITVWPTWRKSNTLTHESRSRDRPLQIKASRVSREQGSESEPTMSIRDARVMNKTPQPLRWSRKTAVQSCLTQYYCQTQRQDD